MKPANASLLTKALLVGWAVAYLPFAVLLAWVSTGPAGLAGPSTPGDDLFAGVWLALSVLQLAVALALKKRERPWLFWVAIILTTLTFGSFIAGQVLALLGVK